MNRTENIPAVPAADPDFARLFPPRNDAESINRALDDTLWLRRAHSVGHRRLTRRRAPIRLRYVRKLHPATPNHLGASAYDRSVNPARAV